MMVRVRSLFSPRREPVNSKQINCRRPGPQIRRPDLLRRSADFHRVHIYIYVPDGFSKGNRANRSRGREKRGKSIALFVPPRIV